jgi:hypothetical protein
MTLPSVNHFLSPEERAINSLAYYGEFFANLDFDDGYRSILLRELLAYMRSFQDDHIDITLIHDESISTLMDDIS